MHIQYNSKKIKKGDIFIAIGKGHNYIEEAINNGASKVIVEYGNYKVKTISDINTITIFLVLLSVILLKQTPRIKTV